MLLKELGKHLSYHSAITSANISDRGLHPLKHELWVISFTWNKLQSRATDSAGLQRHLQRPSAPSWPNRCARPTCIHMLLWLLPGSFQNAGGQYTSYRCPVYSCFAIHFTSWSWSKMHHRVSGSLQRDLRYQVCPLASLHHFKLWISLQPSNVVWLSWVK